MPRPCFFHAAFRQPPHCQLHQSHQICRSLLQSIQKTVWWLYIPPSMEDSWFNTSTDCSEAYALEDAPRVIRRGETRLVAATLRSCVRSSTGNISVLDHQNRIPSSWEGYSPKRNVDRGSSSDLAIRKSRQRMAASMETRTPTTHGTERPYDTPDPATSAQDNLLCCSK